MPGHPHQYRHGTDREGRLPAFTELPQVRDHDFHDIRDNLAAEQPQQQDGAAATEHPESPEDMIAKLVGKTNNVIAEFQEDFRELPDPVGDAMREQIPLFIKGSVQTGERNGVPGLNADEFNGVLEQVTKGIRDVLESITRGASEGKSKAEREAEEKKREARHIDQVRAEMESRDVEGLLNERVDKTVLENIDRPDLIEGELKKFQNRQQKLQEVQAEIQKLSVDIQDFHKKAGGLVKEIMQPPVALAAAGAAVGAAIGVWFFGVGAIVGAAIGATIGYCASKLAAHFINNAEAQRKADECNRTIDAARKRFTDGQKNTGEAAKEIAEDGKILSAAPASIGKKQQELYVERRGEIDARQKETAEERELREKNVGEMAVSRRQMQEFVEELQKRQKILREQREELAKGEGNLKDQRDQLEVNSGEINGAIGELERTLPQLPADHPQAQALRRQLETLQKARDDGGHGLRQIQSAQREVEESGQHVEKQMTETETHQIDLDAHDRSLTQTIEALQQSIPLLLEHEGHLGSSAEELQKGLEEQLKVTGELGSTIGKEALRANVMNVKSGIEMGMARQRINTLPPVETPSFVANVLQGTFEGIGHAAKFVFSETIGHGLDVATRWLKDNVPVIGHILTFPVDVVSGVLHGAGEMIEGLATMIAHPLQTLEGLSALVNFADLEKCGAAWKEMGKALISWKEFESGEIGKGVGKVFLNIALTATGVGAIGSAGSVGRLAFIAARAGGSSVGGAVMRATFTGARAGLRSFNKGLMEMPGWIARAPGHVLSFVGNVAISPYKIARYLRTPRAARLEAEIARDVTALGEITTKIDDFVIGGKKVSAIPELAGRSAQELGSISGEALVSAGLTDARSLQAFVDFRGLVRQSDGLQASLAGGRHAQELRAIAEEGVIADQALATRTANGIERLATEARRPSRTPAAAQAQAKSLTKIVDDINRDLPPQPARAFQVIETTGDGGLIAFDSTGTLKYVKADEVGAFVQRGRATPCPAPTLQNPITTTTRTVDSATAPVVMPSRPAERIPVQMRGTGEKGWLTIENGKTVFKSESPAGRTVEVNRLHANKMLESRAASAPPPALTTTTVRESGSALRILDNADAAKMRVAEAILESISPGKKLTPQQQQAILKANTGKLPVEAQRDLLAKAQFEPKEIDALLESVIRKPKQPVMPRPAGGAEFGAITPVKDSDVIPVRRAGTDEVGTLRRTGPETVEFTRSDGVKFTVKPNEVQQLFEKGPRTPRILQQYQEMSSRPVLKLPIRDGDTLSVTILEGKEFGGLGAGESAMVRMESGKLFLEMPDGRKIPITRPQARALFEPGTAVPKGSPALHRQELRNLRGGMVLDDPAQAQSIVNRLEELKGMTKTPDAVTVQRGLLRNTRTNNLDDFVTALSNDIGRQPSHAWKIIDATADGQLIIFDGNGVLTKLKNPSEINTFIEGAQNASRAATGKPLLRILDNADGARVRVAESIVGRKLSVAERDAVLRAHHKFAAEGRTTPYTIPELKGKAGEMWQAFSGNGRTTDIDKLMRTGVTGQSGVLDVARAPVPRVKPTVPKGPSPVPNAISVGQPLAPSSVPSRAPMAIPVALDTMAPADALRFFQANRGRTVKIKLNTGGERVEAWAVHGTIDGNVVLSNGKGQYLREPPSSIADRLKNAREFEGARPVPAPALRTAENAAELPKIPIKPGEEAVILRKDGTLLRGIVGYDSKNGWHVRSKDGLIKTFDETHPKNVWHINELLHLEEHHLPKSPKYDHLRLELRSRGSVREIRQAKGGLSPQTYEELFPKNAVLQQSSGVGNCWAISALASKRQFHYFEQTMRTSITEVKVGGKVIGWEVRVPLGQSSGEIIRITFKDIAISGRSTLPVNAPAGYRILEATLAKLEARVRPNVPTHTRLGNVNLDVLKGGFGHEALEHLFGPAHEYLHIKPPSLRMSVAENIHSAEAAVAAARTPEAMIAARRELAQARGVRVEMEQYLQTFTNHRDIGTINSIRKSGGSDTVKYRIRGVDYDFHHNHAYSIQSVDRFRKTVSIVNPHNTGRPIVLTWEQAMDVFADVSGMRINANALFRKEPLRGIGRTVPHEQSAVASVRAAAERTNIAPTSTVVPSKKGITVVVPSQVETISVPRQRFIAPVIEESGTLALTGTADEMLGLLSGRKKLVVKRGGQMEQGWKIAGKDAQGNYILQKESQTMSVSTESLVRANLKPHLGSVEELQQQARIMKNMGFTRKQTRFLLENGHGLPKTMDATRLKKLQAELPAIQQAVSDIRRALGENAELSQLLEKYLLDVDHNMSVTSYLKNPKQRKVVLRELQDLTRSKRLSGEQFERIVASMQNENHPLFRLNGEELSFTGGRPRSEILREQLFAKDNTLYPVNDIPSELQRALLNKYAEKLQGDVLPQLKNQLADIVKKSGISGNDGFPAIAARAKSADGLIDKIKRMREGNAGKNPRPTYCLGDMPDAVGGRITVRNPEQLSRVMEELERTFGQGNIFEKDSFYTNAKKQNHPYRVITYTVTVNGTPCEVQLMTLSANVFADLGHNTIYKPLLPASITQAQNFDDLWRGVTARELQNINSPRRV